MNNVTRSLPYESEQRQALFWSWIDQKVRQLIVDLAEKLLHLHLEASLQAGWNQRTPHRRGYRNGYYRRGLTTPHGVVTLRVPRCRDRHFDTTVVFDRYQRRMTDVERILRHTYLLGAGTRGVSELAEQLFGGSVSHQTISRLMRWLEGQLSQWRRQPIRSVYPVVYIDGMHVDMIGSDRTVMLVAGLREDQVLEVLGFCVSRGEQCRELLEDLRRRGLDAVRLFVSDEAPAIRSALEQVYPLSAWQYCTFHRLSGLRRHIGSTWYRDRMVAEAACIFRCESFDAALDVAGSWRRRWQPVDPGAVERFLCGLRDSLRFYDLPTCWWKRGRTNNSMERLIRTLRARLNPMGCFHDEPAIERAVWGQLLRWHKIKLTHNT
jgi:transposase-like protein